MRSNVLILVGLLAIARQPIAAAEDQAASNAEATLPQHTLDWKKAAPSPFARVEAPTAVVGGKLYLFGGFDSELGASPRIDVYDPQADTWSRLKDMPSQVTHLSPAVVGGTIWFAGGFKGKHPGPVTDEVWKYDVAADTWSAGPPLPERRGAGALAAMGNQLHFFGGYLPDRNTDSADHWTLSADGGTAWQREADLPDPRGHISSAVLGGKLYALGGEYGHDVKQVDVKTCQVYDPATSKWTAIASLPDGRSHFESSTIVHDGRILIVGGRCNSSTPPRDVVNDLVEYDPSTDRWNVFGTMPQPLLAPSAALIDGRIIVTCGGLNNPRPLESATRVAPLSAGR
jgi:N-acetylneuraminic acid mutarotase